MASSKVTKKQALEAIESLGPKVTLVGRVKIDRKWKRFNAAYDDKGHIIPNVVIAHGEQVAFPICHYELRYKDGKDMRPDVGDDAIAAEEKRAIVARQLAVRKAAEETGVKPLQDVGIFPPTGPTITAEGAAKRVTLAEVFAEYVDDLKLQRKIVSIKGARTVWKEFIKASGISYLDEVNRKSLLQYDNAMLDRGLADRTVHERHSLAVRILKFAGLDPKKEKFPPTPKYELKLPTVYTSAQIKRLFAEADEYERMVCQILLKLALRDREISYAEFSDIDFEAKVFRVQGKRHYGFKVKDHEQREIPIPSDLLDLLIIWKERHPGQSLILSTSNGIPDRKLCRRVKNLAKRAGLACGTCKTCKAGKGCMDFNLHKFRRTCITGLLLSGMDIRTVAAIAGHSDIKTTMRYLRPVSARKTRDVINQINWEDLNFLGL
jgi:integrase